MIERDEYSNEILEAFQEDWKLGLELFEEALKNRGNLEPRKKLRDLGGVAPFQWHAGTLSSVWREPCIEDEPITPLQGFFVSSRRFPQSVALSFVKSALTGRPEIVA